MEEKFDLFTKIFVDSDVDKEMLLDTVLNIVMGTISGSSILTKQAEIFIFITVILMKTKEIKGMMVFYITSTTLKLNQLKMRTTVTMYQKYLIC